MESGRDRPNEGKGLRVDICYSHGYFWQMELGNWQKRKKIKENKERGIFRTINERHSSVPFQILYLLLPDLTSLAVTHSLKELCFFSPTQSYSVAIPWKDQEKDHESFIFRTQQFKKVQINGAIKKLFIFLNTRYEMCFTRLL